MNIDIYNTVPTARNTFGYYTHEEKFNPNYSKLTDHLNTLNGLSWVPLAGTIVGIVRLILIQRVKQEICLSLASSSEEEGIKFLKANQVRAGFELISLGFLFLLPDIFISIGRDIVYKNTQKRLKNQTQDPFAL